MSHAELHPASVRGDTEPGPDQAWDSYTDRPRLSRSAQIQAQHLRRLAVISVRQSSPQQVLHHRESTALQYDLRRDAVDLGWPPERVLVIDDDRATSGQTAVHRSGYHRLLEEVDLDHVGIILGIERSRLAHSCRDWYHLMEKYALYDTLLADPDGIYDPSDHNDRLLLGLKATMSEAELHLLRSRMIQGRLNQARRGAVSSHPPIGDVRAPAGDRAIQVIQHRTFLQPQRLDHRQHPLHELAPRCAVAADGVLAPQHAQTQNAFRMVVRRFHPLDRREQPQRRIHRQDVGTERRCLAVGAAATLLQDPLEFALDRVQPGLQARSVQFAAAETPPVGEQAIDYLQTDPPDCFSGSSTFDQLPKVALQVRLARVYRVFS